MSKSHGWSDDAQRHYLADKAKRETEQRILRFRERATMLAASYSNDRVAYAIEYSRLCEANLDLSDEVSEIAEYVEERDRSQYEDQMHRLHGGD